MTSERRRLRRAQDPSENAVLLATASRDNVEALLDVKWNHEEVDLETSGTRSEMLRRLIARKGRIRVLVEMTAFVRHSQRRCMARGIDALDGNDAVFLQKLRQALFDVRPAPLPNRNKNHGRCKDIPLHDRSDRCRSCSPADAQRTSA